MGLTTGLHRSPFHLLSVSARDGRRQIVAQAEERALYLDADTCQKARSDLTNPRTRLSAEIAWLPGLSPRKATQLVDSLLHDPMAVRKESGLPTLAHLNLLAAVFEVVDGEHDAKDLASFIQEAAYLSDALHHDEILRDINEDRAVSSFPEARALDQIEAELVQRKRYCRSVVKDALDRLPPKTLIQVMTITVDGVTAGGENHAPELIDALIDSYEVENRPSCRRKRKTSTSSSKAPANRRTLAMRQSSRMWTRSRQWRATGIPGMLEVIEQPETDEEKFTRLYGMYRKP